MASKTRTRAGKSKATAGSRASAGVKVACWEDDPGDPGSQPPLQPIQVDPPRPAASPLPFRIDGTVPPPPQVYAVGTAEFRFYAAAVALRRTADFWGSILPPGASWELGNVLPVVLDGGVDLNAFYTRGGFGDGPGLHFFHDTVLGRAFFSGESPDVVCHEMGHAVLDAIRPQLFDATAVEVAAFHEAFGDISSILSNLQVPSFRQIVINETGGTLNRASRLSRLAEQLGAAIRARRPDLAESDCLRNAANSFFYRDPQTLPPMAPASQLSSEPHSFSRVFSAAFLDVLAGIFRLQGDLSNADNLVRASQDAARILVAGIIDAPVAPDYYSQVAAHMVSVGEAAPFNGKYRDVLKSAFVRRGILSLEAAATVTSVSGASPERLSMAAELRPRSEQLPQASISATHLGLKQASLKLVTAGQPKRFGVTSASLLLGPLEPRSPQNAAQSFLEDLFQRGRVDVGEHVQPEVGVAHSPATKTHVVVQEEGELVLRRKTFDCGFD